MRDVLARIRAGELQFYQREAGDPLKVTLIPGCHCIAALKGTLGDLFQELRNIEMPAFGLHHDAGVENYS